MDGIDNFLRKSAAVLNAVLFVSMSTSLSMVLFFSPAETQAEYTPIAYILWGFLIVVCMYNLIAIAYRKIAAPLVFLGLSFNATIAVVTAASLFYYMDHDYLIRTALDKLTILPLLWLGLPLAALSWIVLIHSKSVSAERAERSPRLGAVMNMFLGIIMAFGAVVLFLLGKSLAAIHWVGAGLMVLALYLFWGGVRRFFSGIVGYIISGRAAKESRPLPADDKEDETNKELLAAGSQKANQ